MDWLLTLAHWFGSAVCHQWPTHSYFIAGVELPLCARCTGMYLGGLATIIYHAWRHPRAIGAPPAWALGFLFLFFIAWGADGANSFAYTLDLFPTPYVPENILRLSTGMLMGITLGTLIFLMFNSLVWRQVRPEPVLSQPGEFIGLLAIGAVIVILVNSQLDFLLYPITILSLVAILMLNSALMAAMASNLMRRFSNNWQEARAPLGVGFAVALTYLDGIALFRVMLGIWTGRPI